MGLTELLSTKNGRSRLYSELLQDYDYIDTPYCHTMTRFYNIERNTHYTTCPSSNVIDAREKQDTSFKRKQVPQGFSVLRG